MNSPCFFIQPTLGNRTLALSIPDLIFGFDRALTITEIQALLHAFYFAFLTTARGAKDLLLTVSELRNHFR